MSFMVNPAYWQSSDFDLADGPQGYGYYSDAYGVGITTVAPNPPSQWVEMDILVQVITPKYDSELVYAGSSYPNYDFAGRPFRIWVL